MTLPQRLSMLLLALTLGSLSVTSACTHSAPSIVVDPDTTHTTSTPPTIIIPEDPDAGTPAPDAGLAAEAPKGMHKPAGQAHFIPEVTLRGEIDQPTADALKAIVKQFNDTKDDGVSDPVEAVVLIMDTPGGSVSAGNDIVDALHSLRMPLVCVVDAHAYSMGFFILESACPTRLIVDRGSIMAHEPRMSGDFTIDSPNRMKLHGVEEMMRVETDTWFGICAKRMGMTLEAFKARVGGNEWWMTADEALVAHAVDGVVSNIYSQVEKPLNDSLQLPAGGPQLQQP